MLVVAWAGFMPPDKVLPIRQPVPMSLTMAYLAEACIHGCPRLLFKNHHFWAYCWQNLSFSRGPHHFWRFILHSR